MMLLWLLALIVVKDRLAFKFNLPLQIFAALPAGAVHLPLLFAFLSQIPPAVGAFYFTHFCNDLAKCQARDNFCQWAVVSVLLSQYIEFSFYGGQGRVDKAGKCRFTKDEGFLSRMINRLFQTKVAPTGDEDYEDVEQEGGEDEQGEFGNQVCPYNIRCMYVFAKGRKTRKKILPDAR